MTNLLAQTLGTFNYTGRLGTVTSKSAPGQFEATISKVLGFLTVMAGLWFMIQLILGAFGWLSAGGDKQHLETARKRITNAIVGLFLVVVAFAVAAIVGSFFGLDILNLGTSINNVAPL